jgi:hypothetical protein
MCQRRNTIARETELLHDPKKVVLDALRKRIAPTASEALRLETKTDRMIRESKRLKIAARKRP